MERSNEVFEAISHPLRIKILKLLAEKPMSFSELKKELGIKSSGKLDYHLGKLSGLVIQDKNGRYMLSKQGYAAIQAIDTVKKYGWQKRAFYISTIGYTVALAFILWRIFTTEPGPVYIISLIIITLWYIYYSYKSIMKRKIFKQY